MLSDTIFAPATAPGKSGVAIIRISGPEAFPAASAMSTLTRPVPRQAHRVRFLDPESGSVIDDGLVLGFPGPASFTGEDVVELHCHGGPAILEALLAALATRPGLRPAEPGEFTRRAFLAGKIDLSQAEGIADLIEAESPAQLAQARRQADGELGRIHEAWRAECLDLLAGLTADIDFADEAIDPGLALHARDQCLILAARLGEELLDAGVALRVKEGYRIAVLGPPNTGKSSFINTLAKRPAVIVSEIPGTTRDVIEIRMRLGRHEVIFADSAGLRETEDEIEAEGVRRARQLACEADLRLWAVPATEPIDSLPEGFRTGDICLRTKSDLVAIPAITERHAISDEFRVSAKTGAGMAEFRMALIARVDAALGNRTHPALTNARQVTAVREASAALLRAADQLPEHVELAAEDLRGAANALGRIAGRMDVEEILGAVFSRFCIGK